MVAALLAIFIFLPPATTVRGHKIAIEVMTPHGSARGESVVEVRSARAPWWYPVGTGNRNGAGLFGEAPYVELGDGRFLFMALETSGGLSLLGSFADIPASGGNGFNSARPPRLIGFTNILDANSVRSVTDNLGAAFGPGYRLVSMTATATSDRPTKGTLAKRFPELYRQIHDQAPYARLKAIGAQDAPPDDPRWINWRAFEAP